MLLQGFNLLSEVIELSFKLGLSSFHLVAVIFFRGEFLLESLDASCHFLVLISIPGKLAVGLIHGFILDVGHHLWPCSLEHEFGSV